MTELEQYIKSFFGIAETEKLHEISTLFKLTKYKRGEFVFETGQHCNTLFFLQAGFLRIYAQSEEKEVTQWICTKGYFGTDLESFFYNKPSQWTIQALVDTEIYMISKSDYDTIKDVVPQWNELEKKFIIKCFTTMEGRIFNHLSMSAEERYNSFFENNKELFNQVPLQYIASMLGMTPETFSRIRNKQFL